MCRILAMYDVRGIQSFIYRTPHIKDAMGASEMIENIISDALRAACSELKLHKEDYSIDWDNETEIYPYKWGGEHQVEVLYIGGGNAFVMYENQSLCEKVNRKMARYVLDNTYSLQLATAWVEVEGRETYQKDYNKLFAKMNTIKADMTTSVPFGALPVMKTELKTGYPAIGVQADKNRVDISTETCKKLDRKHKRVWESDIDKILDNYTRQGKNSRIAVVHIDGNNMGLRIRRLMEEIEKPEDYEQAVNKMREISHNIKYSYLNTFKKMKEQFEKTELPGENAKRLVREIIVAGDDITYVCNAYIALETVRYFSERISGCAMNILDHGDEKEKEENIKKYGFSVCAGIAYIGSHFPFSAAYEVAESCCDSAKQMAKMEENKDGERIGNYVDFQICKNIQCKDLKKIRREEFVTPTGESLLLRPYYIPTAYQYGLRKNAGKENDYTQLVKNIRFFMDEKNIPRSMAKELRNTYPIGKYQVEQLRRFLESRGWRMPDGSFEMYDVRGLYAKWYDALEIMDYNLFPETEEKGEE